ncbi:hypothetical protein QBZ16_004592 [Prototheca wickerhamii]|uniref:CDAN1-interacting nuclease 1 n=1 Tax=Prototheca wickerhamii TaxID=3111 RepID=A0AAD9MKA3_PROWI|nr:hypothetical protein QBZ16_004592 [Prototheca wickerhamii]
MEAEAYAALVSALRAVPATACPLFRALARTFAVPEDTIKSIYGQEWQYQIKSQHSTLLLKLPALVDRFRKDSVSGPAGDAARAAVGVEHERQLYERLNAAGIAYWPEDVLRDRGFFKTPDALLQVPIAVNGAVVHWIDSKATFGDSLMHRTQLAEQYELYTHRFGRGMVIYWFGFVQGLDKREGVLVTDRFPDASAILQLQSLDLAEEP